MPETRIIVEENIVETIEILEETTRIDVTEEQVEIIEVALQGPPGASGAGFVHTQSVLSTEWVVNHNLGFNPSLEIIVGAVSVTADVVHFSQNQARVYFAAPAAGIARCV